ncbi:MAG TPA: hypothetical protein VL625_08835 [Patescibacteria group bacterium]|nr:hypothetical protein [Patescibacteria group bacterium]
MGLKHKFPAGNNGRGITLEQRRDAVMSVLHDAAASAHIPHGLLGTVWGIESHFGKHLTSPTRCSGDFQFSRRTFANIIRDHGAQIAERLKAMGHGETADRVRDAYHKLHAGAIDLNDRALSALRHNAYASTYAAAHLMHDTARLVHVDASKQENWHYIYAGYNLGPKAVEKMRHQFAHTPDVKNHLGSVARHNPQFFHNHATGAQALHNYQRFMRDYTDMFFAHLDPKHAKTMMASNETSQTPVKSKDEPGFLSGIFSLVNDIKETARTYLAGEPREVTGPGVRAPVFV